MYLVYENKKINFYFIYTYRDDITETGIKHHNPIYIMQDN
jgi:hypothetical protein